MSLTYDEENILDANSVLKNAFSIFSVRLFLPILNFLLSILIARALGVRNFGEYSFLLALVMFFQSFQILGLQQYVIKKISADKSQADKYTSALLFSGLPLTVIFYIIVCIYVKNGGYSAGLVHISYIYGLTLFSNLGMVVLETLFIANEKFKYNTYAIILGTVLSLICSFAALKIGLDLSSIIYILAIFSYVTLFVDFFFFTKYVSKIKLVMDPALIKSLIAKAKIFIPIAVLSGLLKSIDVLMLSKISGINAVGFYSASKKFLSLITLIPYSFGMALFPVFSKYYYKSADFFGIAFRKVIILLSVLVLPLVIIMVFLADKLIFLVYGGNFLDCANSMRVLLLAGVFMTFSFIIANGLIIAGKQQYDLITLLSGSAVLMICAVPLSVRYKDAGMAIAFLLAMGVMFFLHYIFLKRYIFAARFLSFTLKPASAAILMAVFIYCFRSFNYLAVSVSSILVYLVIVYIMKIFTKDDFLFFHKMITSFFKPAP